ncbi:hypothetical protein MESS4_830419 [Mesorhizobium sp. STM 4661]|nr:hypothetical protein MESS4_830419 [Mesorhizobium sp. STM 4661]
MIGDVEQDWEHVDAHSLDLAQAVSDAGFGRDVAWLVGRFLDLLPELADIDPEILHVGRIAPDLFQQKLVCEDLACVLYQDAQYVVFLRRQLYLPVLDLDDALHQIDGEIAGLEHRLFALLLEFVTKRHTDARDQLIHAERLGDVVIGAELERGDDAGLVGAAGKDDHGNVQAVVPPFAQQIMSAHAGQAEIEQDQVRLFRLDEFDRRLGVRRLADRIALAAETDAEQFSDRRFVIDDQYTDVRMCHAKSPVFWLSILSSSTLGSPPF